MTPPPRWTWALPLLVLLPIDADGNPHHRPHRSTRPARGRRPPNILILVGDDHAGGTLGIDGDPRRATPRLDALARQGVRFERAYCNEPLCTASRQSFITGRMPHAVGVTQLKTPLPDAAVTLGEWLGDRGYHAAAFGKMHTNDAKPHGFTERLDTADWMRESVDESAARVDRTHPFRPFLDPAASWLNADCRDAGLPASAMESTYVADHAAEFFRRRTDQPEPFLLIVGFRDPHAPFRFPSDQGRRCRPDEFDVPPMSDLDRRERPAVFEGLRPAEVRGIQAAYYTSINYVDGQVGRILDALDASGQAGETIVVYLGDNGYMRGRHGRFEKHCMYEEAVRVPLIVRWPGRLPAGRSVPEMVELVDLVPTLLDLAGVVPPPNLHGASVAPLLRGDPGAAGRPVVVSTYAENEEAMARSDRYKLVVGTGRRLREDGYRAAHPPAAPYEHLFDERADPGELVDRIADPSLAPVADQLRHQLRDRLVGTRDGVEPAPAGLSEAETIRWCLVPRDVP